VLEEAQQESVVTSVIARRRIGTAPAQQVPAFARGSRGKAPAAPKPPSSRRKNVAEDPASAGMGLDWRTILERDFSTSFQRRSSATLRHNFSAEDPLYRRIFQLDRLRKELGLIRNTCPALRLRSTSLPTTFHPCNCFSRSKANNSTLFDKPAAAAVASVGKRAPTSSVDKMVRACFEDKMVRAGIVGWDTTTTAPRSFRRNIA